MNIGSDGKFSVVCPEIVAGLESGGTLTLTGAISAPSQSQRLVSAQLTEIGETLSGAFTTTGSLTPFAGDFFTAQALGTVQGQLYLISGFSGDMQAVVVTPTLIDGARGVLDATGSQTLTTAQGNQLSITINAQTRSLRGTLTRPAEIAASKATFGGGMSALTAFDSIEFVGLPQSVASTSRLINIATRAYCSAGDRVTIGGFVVSGTGAKRVLIRAVGPTLTSQGIGQAEVLLDPVIELHDASRGNVVIATNDDWSDNANVTEITSTASRIGAAALLGTDTKSSALLLSLSAGVYSFVVHGAGSGAGIVLLEVYDADETSSGPRFVNIATRSYATTGNGVTIGGFVVSGNAPKRLLLRSVGPTLAKMGLNAADVLSNPTITLHDASHGNVVIATNDNWIDDGNTSFVTSTGSRVGATPLDGSDSRSAALTVTLQPGVYSFVTRDQAEASGIVLLEVYDAD